MQSRIYNAITTRVRNEWPTRTGEHYDVQARILLEYLSGDTHWGGEETIVAVMEIFNVAVAVYYDHDMVQEFRTRSNAPHRTLNIFYRLSPGSRNNFNHYDSVLSVEPFRPGMVRHPVPDAPIDLTGSSDMPEPKSASNAIDAENPQSTQSRNSNSIHTVRRISTLNNHS